MTMDAQTIIAKRIAQELRPGMLINLGIGIPTLVANYVPQGVNVFSSQKMGLSERGRSPKRGWLIRPLPMRAAGQ